MWLKSVMPLMRRKNKARILFDSLNEAETGETVK
jgi:hypothetical protein